jgi:hypothetical protein
MTPERSRAFWGALLLASFDEPELHHTAVYCLRPNPCSVLLERRDDTHEERHAAFTPAQRRAVARFLGGKLADRRLRFLAAEAILWGWRDEDPAVTAGAEALQRELRSWQRPRAEDPEIEARLVDLESSFAETPPPAPPLVRHICEECAEYALEFAGSDWRRLHPDLVGYHYAAFSLFTPGAFRYFFPATVRDVLLDKEGTDVMFHLAKRDDAGELAAAFTPGERAALGRFLDWYVARYPSAADELAEARTRWRA